MCLLYLQQISIQTLISNRKHFTYIYISLNSHEIKTGSHTNVFLEVLKLSQIKSSISVLNLKQN